VDLTFAEPWKKCEEYEKTLLSEEISKEFSDEHVLFGIQFEVMAIRKDSSQALLQLKDAVFEWAVVYPTYAGAVVNDELPDVDFYIDHEEWIVRCMNCPWS
jgi:hypothetical protein